MKRIEIIKNLLDIFYKENLDKLIISVDVGFEYESISERIKIGTTAIFVASPKNIFGGFGKTHRISFDSFLRIKSKDEKVNIYNLGFKDSNDMNLIDEIIKFCENLDVNVQNYFDLQEKLRLEKENLERLARLEKENLERLAEEKRIKIFNNNKSEVISRLDENIVVIEGNDFYKILEKNQKRIIDIDRGYIQKFVKVSNYIKNKKENIQLFFESIKQTKNDEELNIQINLIKNQIHTYELLIFHSINMVGAIVAEDMIVFYEIYESFDKVGMFNSNWESEVSENLSNIGYKLDDIGDKLDDIGDKLNDLMYSINGMEQNIVSELSKLSYITQGSFEELNRSVTSQLREVESSINTNNLLTGIQTYQLYKINKNIKGLR
nr:hypothetical protein [uncultured Emticicia sp.]